MKINKATLAIEGVFSCLNIEFQTSSDVSIHYLVGNNGQGKSIAMRAMYNAIVGEMFGSKGKANICLDATAHPGSNLQSWSLDVEWMSPSSSKGGKIIGTTLTDDELKHLRKAVYSDVRINFGTSDVSTVTAISVDEDSPKEVSNDLHQKNPQLLVNLKQQDSNKRSKWMANMVGQQITIPETLPEEILPRFVDAYNKIFSGEKNFHDIVERNGKFEILFKDTSGSIVDITNLSSGEQQIIYRLGFILKNIESLDGGLIFIDEPELSLHPTWQLRFKKLLLEIFDGKNVQIFIATHSPYIFGELDRRIEECIVIDRIRNKATKVEFPQNMPSMNLINYLAFNIPTKELHVELFNEVQIKSGEKTIAGTERWLRAQGLCGSNRSVTGSSNFLENNGSLSSRSAEECRPIWIRNKIHHPDLNDRQDFSKVELALSIDEMLAML